MVSFLYVGSHLYVKICFWCWIISCVFSCCSYWAPVLWRLSSPFKTQLPHIRCNVIFILLPPVVRSGPKGQYGPLLCLITQSARPQQKKKEKTNLELRKEIFSFRGTTEPLGECKQFSVNPFYANVLVHCQQLIISPLKTTSARLISATPGNYSFNNTEQIQVCTLTCTQLTFLSFVQNNSTDLPPA